MRTHIVLWKWGQDNMVGDRRYTYQHVNVMNQMLLRNTASLKSPARILCITDEPGGIECETYPLWRDGANLVNATKPTLPSCYRRLRLYDRETQRDMGIDPGDRIVGLDLDTVVCGDLRQILETPGVYVGWRLAGTYHAEVYNGSFQMFTAGTLQRIWSDFDPEMSPVKAKQAGYMGSDQAWLSWQLSKEAGCNHVPFPEFASYPLHLRVTRAFTGKHRLVFFHGKNKPWSEQSQSDSAWIRRYWRE
jgi:hypothetical protein